MEETSSSPKATLTSLTTIPSTSPSLPELAENVFRTEAEGEVEAMVAQSLSSASSIGGVNKDTFKQNNDCMLNGQTEMQQT